MTKTTSLRLKANGTCEEKKKKHDKIFLYMALALFIASFIVMLFQWIEWPGHWWDTDQTLHHEVFVLILLAFGGGLLVARYAFRKK